MMVYYKVKGSHCAATRMEILEERNDRYVVLIVQDYENCRKTSRDFLTRHLFESCLRTGYLIPVESADLKTA